MRSFVVAFLLLSSVVSLHYRNCIYNQKAYLNNLDEIQSKYLADLSKLKERVQKARTDINASSDIAGRIALYQETLADQRDLLSKMEAYTAIPFDTKLCQCNLTEAHKSTIMKSIQQEEAVLRKFKDNVAQRENCSNINQLNREILKEEQYIGVIKDVVNSDCKRLPRPFIEDRPLGLVNIKEYLLVSNLDSTKWIYGSLTESQYKYRMFALATKNNLTKCPENKPFAVSTEECVACPEENPIWDLSTLRCTSCVLPEKYNPYGHNCTTKDITADDRVRTYRIISMNSNSAGENYIGRPSEINPVVATCPVDAPFSDGQRCIRCDLPQIFNYNSLRCEYCPSGQGFDKKLKQCAVGVISSNGFTQIQDTGSAKGEFLTNLNARNLLVPDGADFSVIVKKQRELRESKGNSIALCPADKPYFNGQRCIACYGDSPLFDLNRKECTNCLQGFTYLSTLHKCAKIIRVTNAQAPNLLQTPNYNLAKLYQSIQELRNQNQNAKIENCPIQTPYENHNQCFACPSNHPLFNLETQQCQKCQQGQYYDPNDKVCKKYSRITSPNAPNLYFRGTSKKQYELEYKQAKQSDPTILDCPEETPYFNGKKCISCGSDNPIFSVYVKLCGKCPINRVYDPLTGECKSIVASITTNSTVSVTEVPISEPAKVSPVSVSSLEKPEDKPEKDSKGGAVFSLF